MPHFNPYLSMMHKIIHNEIDTYLICTPMYFVTYSKTRNYHPFNRQPLSSSKISHSSWLVKNLTKDSDSLQVFKSTINLM